MNIPAPSITPLGLRLWPIFAKRDIAALLIYSSKLRCLQFPLLELGFEQDNTFFTL